MAIEEVIEHFVFNAIHLLIDNENLELMIRLLCTYIKHA